MPVVPRALRPFPLPLSAFHPLRVVAARRETEDALSLSFDVPAALRPEFAFTPGQYLTLRTTLGGEEVRRSYSICSGLDEAELRIAIKRVDDGRFSAWAHAALHDGAVIDVLPPEGRFAVPPQPGASRTVLGVAAGSGITPVLSILRTTLAQEPGSRVALLYGSRSTGSILFREALEALKDRYLDRLSVVHVLSREQQDVPVLNGRIDAAKLEALLPVLVPGGLPDLALLCGPGGMIEAAGAALRDAGMPAGRVLSERFTPAGEPRGRRARPAPLPGAAPHALATIIADGIATEVPVAEGEAVLDAALRAGLDLPWSCRGGMCSTCRARVTAGAVSMAVNYGLEPWETEAGYVLTCQSRPTTPRVTVDYDHV